MMSWIPFILTLSLIILVHEWGHFFMARRIGVRVDRFSFGFGPQLLTWTRAGTEYALSLFPFGGYVKLAGEGDEGGGHARPWEYRARSVGERMGIVIAGPFINYLLGFLLFWAVFVIGSPVPTAKIGRILEQFPAAQAGLKAGDRILSVNGVPVGTWEEMTQRIQTQTESITLQVEREGKRFTSLLKPQVQERKDLFGKNRRIARVGIAPSSEVRVQRYPAGEAFLRAGYQVWFLTWATLGSLWNIVTGALSVKESFTGPIGIFYITSVVAHQGVTPLMYLIAVLSVSIGFFNLLPIPVLDGGHLAFLAAEKLRARPVSLRVQERFTRVGLGLLLFLLAVVTYNDLVRFDIGSRLMNLLGMLK